MIDGKAEKNKPGEASHYNGRLKGICYNISETFIKQQTPGYVDIFYAERQRQRDLYPNAICMKCGIECDHKEKLTDKGLSNVWTCPNNSKHKKMYTDGHIKYRATRKMIKAFLKDLWLAWRELEDLPITESYEEKVEVA